MSTGKLRYSYVFTLRKKLTNKLNMKTAATQVIAIKLKNALFFVKTFCTYENRSLKIINCLEKNAYFKSLNCVKLSNLIEFAY